VKSFRQFISETYKDSGIGKWMSQSAGGGPGWDRYGLDGEKIGKCGDAGEGDAYSACLPPAKAKKLGKKGVASFVRRKRDAQKKSGDSAKGGEDKKGQKPVYVKTENKEPGRDYYERMADKLRKAGFDLRKPISRKKAWDVIGSMAVSRLADKGYIDIEGGEGRQKRESVTESDNVPTNPSLWKKAISKAKSKFDVYPSAYANAWASKWYKEQGGGWKKA